MRHRSKQLVFVLIDFLETLINNDLTDFFNRDNKIHLVIPENFLSCDIQTLLFLLLIQIPSHCNVSSSKLFILW